jgi:general secretion pathway protein H
MFIIGIILTFTMLAFGDFGKTRQVNFECEKISQIFRLARERALIESKVYAAELSAQGYEFFVYEIIPGKTKGRWNKLIKQRLFKSHRFPKNVKINVSTSARKTLFLSDGTLSPFTIKFSDDEPICTVEGFTNGQVKYTKYA